MSQEDIARNRAFIAEFENLGEVIVRPYKLDWEIRGTCFEPYADLLIHSDGDLAHLADKARLLILGKYGGVYFDFDILFLRDIRPLCSVEFCYQWSNRPYANNALLHFQKDSGAVLQLLDRGRQIGTVKPTKLLRFQSLESLNDVLVFPSYVFDPAWISNDLRTQDNSYCNCFDDFFLGETSVNMTTFFPASYAYHWHNRWTMPIRTGTIVGQLFAEVDKRFTQL